jgi:hypothetical protein
VIPFGVQTVTLIRRVLGVPDAYGNDVYHDVREALRHCQVQPNTLTKEALNGRDQVEDRMILHAPPTARFESVDAVDVAGVRYEVHGQPKPWPDWSGGVHHIEVVLQRIEG